MEENCLRHQSIYFVFDDNFGNFLEDILCVFIGFVTFYCFELIVLFDCSFDWVVLVYFMCFMLSLHICVFFLCIFTLLPGSGVPQSHFCAKRGVVGVRVEV